MDVTRTRALRGPNLWSRHMAIEAVVTCTETERAIGKMAGFEDRLRALFPAIGVLHPEGGRSRHLAGPCAANRCPGPASPGRLPRHLRPHARPPLDAGVYQVVVEYSEEAVGRMALRRRAGR